MPGMVCGSDLVVTPADSKATFRWNTNKRLNAPVLGLEPIIVKSPCPPHALIGSVFHVNFSCVRSPLSLALVHANSPTRPLENIFIAAALQLCSSAFLDLFTTDWITSPSLVASLMS